MAPYLPTSGQCFAPGAAGGDRGRAAALVSTWRRFWAPFCTTHFLGWPSFLDEDQGYEFYRQAYTSLLAGMGERGVAVTLENDRRTGTSSYFRETFSARRSRKPATWSAMAIVETARSMTRSSVAPGRARAHPLSDNDGSAGDDHLPLRRR
ncbi:MAG: hypothetical protein U0X20_25035 [Caldilineaceae bacterium]